MTEIKEYVQDQLEPPVQASRGDSDDSTHLTRSYCQETISDAPKKSERPTNRSRIKQVQSKLSQTRSEENLEEHSGSRVCTKHQLIGSHWRLVEKMIGKFIDRVFKKSKVPCFQVNFEFYKNYLYHKLWPEAKKLRRHINRENFKGLHKAIHKDMQKIFKFKTAAGLSDTEKAMFEDLLIRLFKLHLSKKPVVYTEIEDCSEGDALYLEKIGVLERVEKKVSFKDFRETFNDEEFEKRPFGLTSSDPEFWSASIQSDLQLRKKQEKCNLLINQYLTDLIPLVFEKADVECSKANFDHLFNRLYEKLWDLCATKDFTLTEDGVKNLAKVTYKYLLHYSKNKDCIALMALDLYEPPCDIIVKKTFEKYMLREKSKVSKFFRVIGKVLTRTES
ncbi:uncharacterized protein LOC112140685 [Oryzias melastigma]|uniref:uncharacterized protein LOC112140685 n=1 Tax=Oryzias melastigma TaxID=30732 RepID=UPI000CF80888|nr:uncharacterized protein LOC112140685 [Oryzias melastigma]